MKPAKTVRLKPNWQYEGDWGVELFGQMLIPLNDKVNRDRRYHLTEVEAIGLAAQVNEMYDTWVAADTNKTKSA